MIAILVSSGTLEFFFMVASRSFTAAFSSTILFFAAIEPVLSSASAISSDLKPQRTCVSVRRSIVFLPITCAIAVSMVPVACAMTVKSPGPLFCIENVTLSFFTSGRLNCASK